MFTARPSWTSWRSNTSLKFHQTDNTTFYFEAWLEQMIYLLWKHINSSFPVTVQCCKQASQGFAAVVWKYPPVEFSHSSVHEKFLDIICSQSWAYGNIDWWCFGKDHVLPTTYEYLRLVVIQSFQARFHCPQQNVSDILHH